MKLLTIILSCMLFLNNIYASTNSKNDITANTTIKYKWYIEEQIDGKYHHIGENLPDYIEDSSDITYGNYTNWNSKYCDYSKDKYLIDEKIERWRYKKVRPVNFIILENLQTEEKIRVFSKNQELEYTKKEISENKIILTLKTNYDVDKLWFYIKTDKEYDITLTAYENIDLPSLSKHVQNSSILFPDETWINSTNIYVDSYVGSYEEENAFNELIQTYNTCRVREIKTYRYKVERKYYDENYHEYIEGYIPDTQDYIVEYNGDFPTNIIEITKTEFQPVNKYIYIEPENSNKLATKENIKEEVEVEEQTSNNCIIHQDKVIEKIKYVDKETYKVPKKIYILIIILILVIILQTIKLIKRKSNKIFN